MTKSLRTVIVRVSVGLIAALLLGCGRTTTTVVADAQHGMCGDFRDIVAAVGPLERGHPKKRFELLSRTTSKMGWTAITATRVIDPSWVTLDDAVRETLLVSFAASPRSGGAPLNDSATCTIFIRGSAGGPGHVTAMRPIAGVATMEGDILTIDLEADAPEVLHGRKGYRIERTTFRIDL